MPATERLVAILKAGDISRTVNWYAAAGFEIRGSHPEGYHLTFTQRATPS